MALLDFVTGGKSGGAEDALRRAEAYFSGVRTPTKEELTLPELEQYVQAGILTPAQAQAYLQESNAYANQVIPQTGTQAQIEALNRLSEVAGAGPEGTPLQQAQMANTLSQMNTAIGGQRGAIEQAMAAKGTPQALIQAALANQTVGQEGQQAYLNAVNAQGQAYQNALNAMSQGGALGGQLQGQQNAQANQVAGAQNAMQQFNAANQQQNSQFNAANQTAANLTNLQNKQNVGNQNVGLANTRTAYNANLPQQIFQNQMAKAQGQAGAATNIGNLYEREGQQNAGLMGGLLNTAATVLGGTYGGPAGAVAANQIFQPRNPTEERFNRGYAKGGIVDHDHGYCMAHGGICLAEGGQVPGRAPMPGNTEMNDIVHANLSPGEAVIPRSSVAQNPEIVMSLLGQREPEPQIDFRDVASLLKAMRSIRMGVS